MTLFGQENKEDNNSIVSRQLLRVLANFIINKSKSQIGIEYKYEQIKKT